MTFIDMLSLLKIIRVISKYPKHVYIVNIYDSSKVSCDRDILSMINFLVSNDIFLDLVMGDEVVVTKV